MDKIDIFYENFFSFVRMLGGAPRGEFFLTSFMAASASGEPYAGENYAIFGAGASSGEVDVALDFFHRHGADFIVPWLPQTPCDLVKYFEEKCLARRRIYTAMYLPASDKNVEEPLNGDIRIATADRRLWGLSVWRAFGGEDCEAAGSYSQFGEYLASRSENSAYALRKSGRLVSTALIHETENTCGLYYFATEPDHRRRKCATRLMKGLAAELSGLGKPLVLLATEEGLPFYIRYGFKIIERIPIYSLTDEI